MKYKILAIDDEQIVLDSIKKILSTKDFETDVFLQAGAGIYQAITKDYDLVLTDIRMPNIDGLQVLRDIKRFKPHTPILIITGYATINNAVMAMRLGATDYIEKPFTPEQLIQAMTSAIEKAAQKPHEEQTIIHANEIMNILERGAEDEEFAHKILHDGAEALDA
jgi:DNA-binding NtrC family response regulator